MELNQLRSQIDEIDRELVALFIKRMNCAAKVAEYKKEYSLPVLDKEREKALLQKIAELSGEEFEKYTSELYKTILSLSREYQEELLNDACEENE